jgi:prevent-host-death family protein
LTNTSRRGKFKTKHTKKAFPPVLLGKPIPMALTVKVAEAKARLSELLAKVEAGEEVIIARGNEPIARLTRIRRENDVRAVIEEIKAARKHLPSTTVEEILAWRHEGHRY